MFVFISGAARGGKSAWAEEYALSRVRSYDVPLVYLATTRVCDQEMEKRVLCHQVARKNKGFETLERDVDVSGAVSRLAPSSTVLLECLGTLLANETFGVKDENAKAAAAKIYEELSFLKTKVANLLVVSNDVFSDGVVYGRETELYRQALGALHVDLAREADLAVECVCGRARIAKD